MIGTKPKHFKVKFGIIKSRSSLSFRITYKYLTKNRMCVAVTGYLQLPSMNSDVSDPKEYPEAR